MREIDLNQFCDNEDGSVFSEPFSLAGYRYATDKRIAIRKKIQDEPPGTENAPRHHQVARNLFEQYDWGDLTHLIKSNPFETTIFVPCEECGGSGEVEFENDYHWYSVKCKSCEDKGRILENRIAIKIEGLAFDNEYLALIDAPDLKGKIVGDVLLCEFDQYQCVLMRMMLTEGKNHG